MEEDLKTKFEEQDQKLEAIYKAVEKMRKYFLWTMIITIALIVIPVIGLTIVIPSFINNYIGGINDATQFLNQP